MNEHLSLGIRNDHASISINNPAHDESLPRSQLQNNFALCLIETEQIPELGEKESSNSKQHVDSSNHEGSSSHDADHSGPFENSKHLEDNDRHANREEESKIQTRHPAADDHMNAPNAIRREFHVNEQGCLIEEEASQPLSSEPNHELSERNRTDRSAPIR